MEMFYVWTKYVQSRPLQNCRMRERVNYIGIILRSRLTKHFSVTEKRGAHLPHVYMRVFDWFIDCMVLIAAFNNLSFISRHFLGKLPALLVHLSWHHPASRNSNPFNPERKGGQSLIPFSKALVWPERGLNQRPSAPKADRLGKLINHGDICLARWHFTLAAVSGDQAQGTWSQIPHHAC